MSVAGRTDSREEIINQLIACYEKDLLRLCYVSLGDAALAEDAVQETFWKAYRHWSTFRGGSSEKTWLIRIAINVCRDMARKGWFRMARATVALEGAALSQPEEGRETHTALMAEILALP